MDISSNYLAIQKNYKAFNAQFSTLNSKRSGAYVVEACMYLPTVLNSFEYFVQYLPCLIAM